MFAGFLVIKLPIDFKNAEQVVNTTTIGVPISAITGAAIVLPLIPIQNYYESFCS
jgi:hypothetical protein